MKLTKEGYEAYKLDIEKKKKELIDLGIFKGQVAVECGNVWHDNHTFEQTEIQERALITIINEMNQNLANAEIIESSNNKDIVDVGAIVEFNMSFIGTDEAPERMSIKVVGKANPDEFDEITLNSPLGKALFEKKVGDSAQYFVNGNCIQVEIIKISY